MSSTDVNLSYQKSNCWESPVIHLQVNKSLPKNNMVIIERLEYTMTSTIGKYGVGDRCASGERLLIFVELHEFLISNTCFRHCRFIHVELPDNIQQLIFQPHWLILISHRWKSSVFNNRSYQGAETGNLHGSYHIMVPTMI